MEESAALAFRGSSQAAVMEGPFLPVEFYVPLQTDGLVLVAHDTGDVVGFAASQACADALHLWELDVRLDRQGQGIGGALVAETAALARLRGLPAVTLTTYSDIAWNAPFYRRRGFEVVEPASLDRRLLAIREREAGLGLDMPNRCAMRLDL